MEWEGASSVLLDPRGTGTVASSVWFVASVSQRQVAFAQRWKGLLLAYAAGRYQDQEDREEPPSLRDDLCDGQNHGSLQLSPSQ